MASIEDTLKEIGKLQDQITREFESSDCFDPEFCTEIMNYSSVYFYDLLAHSCMDLLKSQSPASSLPGAYQHYFTNVTPEIMHEIIRFQNISGLFIVWNIFSQFIFRIGKKTGRINAGEFPKIHKKVIEYGAKRSDTKKVIETFTGIRRTRNSLHQDGNYTEGENQITFEVQGKSYTLTPEEQVVPIRIMDVLNEMWIHYHWLKYNRLSKK